MRGACTAFFACASLSAVMGILIFTSSAHSAANFGQKQPARQVFKNIRILKEMPADDLVPTMEFMASSLGVECDFCHDRNAFEKDDKLPKQAARRMIELVSAINGQSFQGQRAVTCWTCHRGSIKPVAIPMLPSTAPYVSEFHFPADQPFPAQDNLPPADTVLARYIAALGGEQAINKVSTRIERGTVSFSSGPPVAVELTFKIPDKQLMILHLTQGDTDIAFDGYRGWQNSAASPVREMHAAEIAGVRLDADLQLPLDLNHIFADFKVIQQERVGRYNAILVFAGNPAAPPVELYFDERTGLLVRQLRFAPTQLGLNPTQIDYEDYTPFDGLMIPVHVTINRPGSVLDMRFAEVRQNSGISDSIFEKPSLSENISHAGPTPTNSTD